MPDNWGYVARGRTAARRPAALFGYWRHLCRRARALLPDERRRPPMSRRVEVHRRRPRHRGRPRVPHLRRASPSRSCTSSRRASSAPRRCAGKAYRLGGMVKPGTLKWEPRSLDLSFALSDGQATVPVRHKGTPPDLFGEGRGAVVEGTWSGDGYFQATLIMAKHSEEYKAPHDPNEAGLQGAPQDAARGRRSMSAARELRPGARLRADRGRPSCSALYGGGAAAVGATRGRPALVESSAARRARRVRPRHRAACCS